MRSALSFASCGLVVLGLSACGSARDSAQTGTNFCFNCHSETSALGIKIKWAEAGYANSVHFGGQVERDYIQVNAIGGCPPFVQATAATCTAQGGTHSGAAGGNVCTMPASASEAQCVLAGGAVAGPVADPQLAPGIAACPPFQQAPSTPVTNSPCVKVFGAGALVGTACTPVVPTGATYVTQNACQSAGGAWVGPAYVLAGEDKAGSNAFYANSGGCQMCHTQEGFRKRVSGAYDDDGTAAARYGSIKFAWDPNALQGSPSSLSATPPVTPTPLTKDVILNPSPLGCFGCHTPHGIGTVDNVHLDQTIPVGTAITTQTGAIWGNASTGTNKAKGHMCAECHQVRLNTFTTSSASILANVAGAAGCTPTGPTACGKFNVSAPYGPHHGPQTDMFLGKGGAQYTGTSTGTAGSVAFAGTYRNSPHTTNVNADCISCHMQDDFSDINVTGSFSVNAAVGGHSFTNKGIVHGAEKALVIGCGSITDTIGCHTVAGVATSTGNKVVSANIARTIGYLQAGDAYFQKFNGGADSNYHLKMNELLTKLANPSADCTGLINSAAIAAGGKFTWLTMPDGVTIDPRCLDNGTLAGAGINKAAAPADDNTNASVRFLKALWNFKFANKEDKSFGVHNTTYALELLYDTCTDLAVLTGEACGANVGRCSFCEGQFVTTRP